MSSDRPTSTSSIIPDGFTDAYDAETVEEALRRAETATSTTPASKFDRCRSCGSQRIREKTGIGTQPNRVDGEIKCVSCSAHFDEPLPPTAEFSVDDPGCPECASFRLVEDTDDAYECLDCGWNGEAVADDPPDSYVPMTDARTDAFDWADADDLADPDDRGDGPTLPGVDDETLADIVVALYDTSAASYRDLAEVVPYSREWVGSRVRERQADELGGGS